MGVAAGREECIAASCQQAQVSVPSRTGVASYTIKQMKSDSGPYSFGMAQEKGVQGNRFE